ncbi:hypothetical protein DEO72_LG5g1372 [Vigna unguiculata]|uniref:Uncharacterized protein n=1 Tax=Vigna unguiculata TaxID=3917 RepID=A0A4D6LW68_VIGUN|nr:hypothetical protein DEO72_LG5g1372 [Vigna unguiculata]
MRRSGGTQWLSATCSSSWHSQVEGVLNEEAVMDGDRCLRVAVEKDNRQHHINCYLLYDICKNKDYFTEGNELNLQIQFLYDKQLGYKHSSKLFLSLVHKNMVYSEKQCYLKPNYSENNIDQIAVRMSVHCFVAPASQQSPSPSEVAVSVTVRSHRLRHHVKSPSPCEVASSRSRIVSVLFVY